jgi:hypothetical protein
MICVSSIVSAPYQLALAAHHRAGLYDIARDPFVMNDTIAAFMAKVSVEGDDGLDAHLPGCGPARDLRVAAAAWLTSASESTGRGVSTGPLRRGLSSLRQH